MWEVSKQGSEGGRSHLLQSSECWGRRKSKRMREERREENTEADKKVSVASKQGGEKASSHSRQSSECCGRKKAKRDERRQAGGKHRQSGKKRKEAGTNNIFRKPNAS